MNNIKLTYLLVNLVKVLSVFSASITPPSAETESENPKEDAPSMYAKNPFLSNRMNNYYYNHRRFSPWNNYPNDDDDDSMYDMLPNYYYPRNFYSRYGMNRYLLNFYRNNPKVNSNNGECGISLRVNQLIVNGAEFEEGTYPWLAALFLVTNNDLNFICGGTLISQKHVLTAAHCVVRNNATVDTKSIMVNLGKSDLQNVTSTDTGILKVDVIHVHPKYKLLSSDGDIAVIGLQEKVNFSRFVRPACLWKGNDDLQDIVGVMGTIAGWGKNENGTLSLDRPREVQIPVVSQETCLRRHPTYASVTSERTFCAGFKNGNTGPCNGDSGNGFIIKRFGQWVVRGIVSVSLSNGIATLGCDLSFYVVFTDVSKFISWIYSAMK